MTLAEKRRNAMQFFNNPTMTTDMNRVNNAIQSISNEEKVFKMGLKKDIAREEYKKLGEEPKKQNQNKDNRNKDVMTPPDNFSTDTHYTHNEDFSEFKCTECGEEFSFQQDAIIHMEKEQKKAWLKNIESKMESDKRFTDWHESPADIKHLTVKVDLPNPDIDLNESFVRNNPKPVCLLHEEYEQQNQDLRKELSKEKSVVKHLNKKIENYDKNVERTVRKKVKQKLVDEQEVNKENIEIISTEGNVIKARKTKVIVEKNTGRKRHQSNDETYINVTTKNPYKRKSNTESEGPQPKLTPETLRVRSKKVLETIEVISNNAVEAAVITAKVVDKKNEEEEFRETFKKSSHSYKERNSLTVEEAADEVATTHMSRRALRKRITGLKKHGKNIYPSEKKVMNECENRTPINTNDYKKDTKLICKNKQGNKKACVEETAVTMVKDVKQFVAKVIKTEAEFLTDEEKVDIAVSVDAGGKRVVSEVTIVNRSDKKVKPHIMVLFEGTDNYHNLSITLGELRDGIKELNGSEIFVNNKTLKINIKTVLDGSALSTIMGKQGASATSPCVWTDVTREHLTNHTGRDHTPKDCPDIKFLTKEDYRENLKNNAIDVTNKGIEQGRDAMKVRGAKHGNVVGTAIIDLNDPLDNVPALMHIMMGLLNDVLDELHKEIQTEDKKIDENTPKDEEKVEELDKLEEQLRGFKEEFEDQALASSMAVSDKKRLKLIIEGKDTEAENEAKNSYKTKSKKKKTKKTNCAASKCVIFPSDEEAKCDATIKCQDCGKKVHLRCEGIVQYNVDDDNLPDRFKCNKCEGENENKQLEKIEQAQETIDQDMAETERDITETEGKIKNLDQEMEEDLGPRQKKFKMSFVKMGVSTSQYWAKSFGGSLEGNQCQKVFDDARTEKYELLEAIKDKEDLVEKYTAAIKCLATVDKKLKMENDNMSEEQVKDIKEECEKWGEIWPHYFTNRSITPKGHWLIFVLPKFIEKNRTFHMYYRCEQACEKIHALLNKIESNLLHVKNKHERHRIMIARFEQRHGSDLQWCVPEKRKLKSGTGKYQHSAEYIAKRLSQQMN